LALLAGALAALAPGADVQNLLQTSPFAPVAVTNAPGQAAASLEFRGVFADQGEYFFSLYDTATRRGAWVALNEPGNPFTVRAYDPANETVTAEYQGRTLQLTLKTAKILVSAASPVPPAPNAPGPAASRHSAAAQTAAMTAPRAMSRRRGSGFTLVEVLLALAVMALLGALLLPGVNSILRSLEVSTPDQLVWETLNQVREQALTGNRTIWLQPEGENSRLVWSDGQKTWTRALPAGCQVQLLQAQTGSKVLIGGQLIETREVAGVSFYPDGTCDAFRVQLRRGSLAPQILRVDPWTCAPIIAAGKSPGEI
jgi:prepilin-type N-terminal cleavage/methylation domain-containing protein